MVRRMAHIEWLEESLNDYCIDQYSEYRLISINRFPHPKPFSV